MFWLLPAFAFLGRDIANKAYTQASYGKKIAEQRGVNLPSGTWDRLRTYFDLGQEAVTAAGGDKELIAVRVAEAKATEAEEAGAATSRVLETVYGEQPDALEELQSLTLPMITAADAPVATVAATPTTETNWALLAGAGLLAWAWIS